MQEQPLRERGLEALRQRRVRDAIALLTEHLQEHPGDFEAAMELGLAELIAGERERFAGRYATLCKHFTASAPATARARVLWDRCRRVGESMAAAAVLLTAAGIPATAAGCAKKSPPEPSPPVTVQVPATVESTKPVAADEPSADAPAEDASAPDDEPLASATPSAAVPPPIPPPIQPATPPPTTTRPRPKTRYIAIRPDPVPKLNP